MKISLISPQFPHKGGFPLAPPSLEYLGALTMRHRPDSEITVLDANREEVSPNNIHADLAGISIMTPTATWSYDFADKLRKRGITVVVGGIHASALPEEALRHADAVVVGEAESVWGTVLTDAERKRLHGIYIGERLPLAGLPTPRRLLRQRYPFRAVFTARGCINKCSFCSVRRFFGDTVRFRPIDDVVHDVEDYAGRIYYNGDDNIWGSNIERSIDLFRTLAQGPKRWWFGQGDLATVQRPRGAEMLKHAFDSGLRSVWAGYESDNESTLDSYRAASKQGIDRFRALRIIADAGIEIVLFMILGGKTDSLADFEKTLAFSDKMGLTIHPVLLTPYPGTETYWEYTDSLIRELPWGAYDGVHAVFKHPDPAMTVQVREEGLLKLNADLFTFPRVLRRIGSIDRKGFPVAHLVSFMKQIAMRRGFRKAYESYRTSRMTEQAALSEKDHEEATQGTRFLP